MIIRPSDRISAGIFDCQDYLRPYHDYSSAVVLKCSRQDYRLTKRRRNSKLEFFFACLMRGGFTTVWTVSIYSLHVIGDPVHVFKMYALASGRVLPRLSWHLAPEAQDIASCVRVASTLYVNIAGKTYKVAILSFLIHPLTMPHSIL